MKFKSWILPLIGVLILLFFLLAKPIDPLTKMGMKVVGIFLFTIIWWVTVGVGYPSIITVLLLITTGVMSTAEAFANSWGYWVSLFVLGSFGMSECLKQTGFSKRFALWFVTRRVTARRPWMLITMFLLANVLLGSVMPLTPTCIIFMAIAEPMLLALGYQKGDSFAAMLMMGIAWVSTSAAGMTPIGQTGNIMMIDWVKRDLKYTISFPQWMVYGIPTIFLVWLILILVFRFVVRPDVSKVKETGTQYVREEMRKMGPMKLEESLALIVFLIVIFLWMFPGIFGKAFPVMSANLNKWGFAVPPLIGACVMCLIRVKGKPLLTFHEWMWSGVEWGTISLLGAIFAIGAVIAKPETGIPAFITAVFKPLVQTGSLMTIIIITVVWVVLQTNAMSNIVSETLVYNVMVPIIVAAKVGSAAALGAVISSASNQAFTLPSATTTTAVVIGSGWVSAKFMAKYGAIMIIPTILIFILVGYPLAALMFR